MSTRETLAESIDRLPEDQWTDNSGDDFDDGYWYPAILVFGKEVLYCPLAWALHEQGGFTDEELQDMIEPEAERHLKSLFGVNKHEVNEVARLTVGVNQETARNQIKDYLTKRG